MEGNMRLSSMIQLLKENGYEMEDLEQLFLEMEKRALEKLGVQPKEEDTRKRINKILKEIGVPQKNRGYEMLIMAIQLAYENPEEYGHKIIKLYETIEKMYGANKKTAERNLRTVIELACQCDNYKEMKKFFGNAISAKTGRPTTKQFILTISNYMRMEE